MGVVLLRRSVVLLPRSVAIRGKQVVHALGASLVLAGVLACEIACADPGLLLIAHGSPSAAWNQEVLDLGQRVAEEVGKTGEFCAVRTAFLEAAQPDVPTALAELEAQGCDRIVAVPLFIAPSGHSHFDVPLVLGTFFSPPIAKALAEEGLRAAQPKVPVMVTCTLDEGDLLPQFVIDQVRKLSKAPQDEALVILLHGDPDHQLLIERLMRRIATQACGATGIQYADWASIGMGMQDFRTQGAFAISRALEHKRRVLVAALYLATSAEEIHRRATARHGQSAHDSPSNSPQNSTDNLFDGDVVFSAEKLISHPGLLAWVVQTARAAVEDPSKTAKVATPGIKNRAAEKSPEVVHSR